MAINKAKTSPAMKIGIIVLIVAFVSSFMYAGFAGLFESFKGSGSTTTTTQQSTTPTATVESIAAQYKPGIDALNAAVASNPTSYTALVQLGNGYFDWAQTLSTPAQNQSRAATDALIAAVPLWGSAKDAYSRALKVKPGDPSVTTDFSIVTFYSGDTTTAIVTAEKVTKADPKFAQAWLNLGIFYGQSGQTAKAVAAFQEYLKLDPNGQNAAFAKQEISALQQGTTKP